MKMKKWLSRGIVLAMVVAMMVPMPVAAKSSKSSKGGKLVKSVTYYDYDNGADGQYGTADDKYQLEGKVSYTYDKKGNPNEIKSTTYTDFFLNIPTSANIEVKSLKYSYKGKSPKSMTMTNEAGFVKEKRTYKGGKLASYTGNSYVSTRDYDDKETGKETSSKYNGSLVYNKSGNVVADCEVYGDTKDGVFDGYDEYNHQYYVVAKKGIPSYVYTSLTNWKGTAADGTVTTEDWSSEGGSYASFNGKGLITQAGFYDAKANKYEARSNYQYVMKKGLVKEVIVFTVNDNGKEEAAGKYVFEYNKTKASKQRYMNMINDTVTWFGSDEYFAWF